MPISPDPVREWRDEWIPAYLSNGLIGMRCGAIPLIEGVAIVNGLASVDPVERGEAFSRGPYPLGGDLEVSGCRLSRASHRARLVEQFYDFACGELRTKFLYQADDATATVDVLTFCSRSIPSVVLQEVRVTVDGPAKLTVTATVDQTGVNGRLLSRETTTPGAEKPTIDGSMLLETHGALATCGAAYITQFDGGDGVERKVDDQDQSAPLSTSYTMDARPGRQYVLRHYTSLIPSQLHHEPNRQAARLVGMACRRGFDKLRTENRAAWEEIWQGRIKLVGADEKWQAMADAAFYYLQASAHSSSLFSTSMFGLAYWVNYHYYRGHVMWDIETFTLPVLLLTAPPAARALLAYRAQHQVAAQRNAAMFGYRGLQFPWASGPRQGEEVIRLSAPQIVFEQHVSLSVAKAFALYAHVTGDKDFLEREAWPVLEGVADWIVSRFTETPRGQELRELIGVAEIQDPVDNNAYMNMAASVVLAEAAGFARRLKRGDPDSWERIRSEIFIPKDPTTGIILNHDRYKLEDHGQAAATPEALAGFFPFGYETDRATERKTMEFYLGKVEEFIGSPMLSALVGVYAARLGDRARALRFFTEGYAEYVQQPYGEANEFSRVRHPEKPRVGPFMANLGGFLMSCLYGLTGLKPGEGVPESWFTRPVVLPEGWEAIEVDRVYVRGGQAGLVARHGDERGRLIR